MRRLIFIALLTVALPLAANAQTWPGWPGPPPPGYDPGSAIADQHRIEMDRLRNQAAEREALAQQQRLQTQLTIQRLEAARQPTPPLPPPTAYTPRTLEQERQAREAQTARREEMVRGVTEIDAWLDRRPH
ncbi:hypothetical protein [Brevundimonas sp.]|uniref:hypothetical protein n=1 Tax=Brevundimonas sp. TaxID=1871086 RepID=UPI00289F93D4|nr:hypothetical protein [Brevundimonas sp.]